MRLLIATMNTNKVRQLQATFATLNTGVVLVTPTEAGIPADFDVEETGETYAENAEIKALAFARESGLPALADDSGLEVEALGGVPGVHSKRYAPDDAARIAKLVAALHAAGPDTPRDAHFTAVLALALPAKNEAGAIIAAEGTGILRGQIIDTPHGTHGFGYDPIFFLPQYSCTLAELNDSEIEDINHRGQAARAIAPNIGPILRDFYGIREML